MSFPISQLNPKVNPMMNCQTKFWKREVAFTDNTYIPSDKPGLKIGLFHYQKKVNIVTEVPLYGSKDFIADFGGYLGLLLGASVLTFVDMLEALLHKIKNMMNSK